LKKYSYSSSIDNQQKLQQILQVNERLNVSILVEITFSISPYKVFKNNSNGHDCYVKKIVIILIFE